MKFTLSPAAQAEADNWRKLQLQAQRAAPKALKVLIGLIHAPPIKYATDAEGNTLFTPKGRPIVAIEAVPPSVQLGAIRELFDRAFGRPATMTTEAQDAFTDAVQTMISERPLTTEQWKNGHKVQ